MGILEISEFSIVYILYIVFSFNFSHTQTFFAYAKLQSHLKFNSVPRIVVRAKWILILLPLSVSISI